MPVTANAGTLGGLAAGVLTAGESGAGAAVSDVAVAVVPDVAGVAVSDVAVVGVAWASITRGRYRLWSRLCAPPVDRWGAPPCIQGVFQSPVVRADRQL